VPSLTIGWLHIIVLLGALQGLILTGALLARQQNRTANRLLAAAMLAFTLHLTTSVYHAVKFEEVAPHFFGVGYPLPLLYGPLIYLYALTAADRNRRLTRRDALHLVPFLVTVLGGIPTYIMSGAEKLEFYHRLLAGERTLLMTFADPLKFVSGIAYACATILFLRRHREQVKESYSSTERVNLRWLFWLGMGAAGIWVIAVTMEVVESAGILDIPRSDDIVSVTLAVLVYAIGYKGFTQSEIFKYYTAEYAVVGGKPAPAAPLPAAAPEPATAAVAVPAPAEAAVSATESGAAPSEEREAPAAAARYERSGLSSREARKLREALTAVMEREHPWKESDLTLADLAERLATTPHKLSEVLNSEVGQTFYDFVNGYRVREVQRRIAAGEARSRKMLALAYDAGFASKSTFNEVFKKHTSQTPSDFRATAGV
jgi:AraC-like DNA-binding protein